MNVGLAALAKYLRPPMTRSTRYSKRALRKGLDKAEQRVVDAAVARAAAAAR